MDFYNTERPHSALAGRTSAEAYGAGRLVDTGRAHAMLSHHQQIVT
ncbi:MAG: hypothetical protein V3U39_09610 [Acidimicrobiia bacterium]